MFQGWQVGAISIQAASVCPPVCLLVAHPNLSGCLLNHLHVSGQAFVCLAVSLSICLLTPVHLFHVRVCWCGSVWVQRAAAVGDNT